MIPCEDDHFVSHYFTNIYVYARFRPNNILLTISGKSPNAGEVNFHPLILASECGTQTSTIYRKRAEAAMFV